MVLIRRVNGSGVEANWHEPHGSSYVSEEEFKTFLLQDPKALLPGEPQLAVVDEFVIDGFGKADLVGVGAAGDITIVECKLGRNPEIRRKVVGQILAYAGGLWRMSYERFSEEFGKRLVAAERPVSLLDAVKLASSGAEDPSDEELQTRRSVSLLDAVKRASSDAEDLSEEELRVSVTANLAAGQFRLVLAVDSITQELRRIIEFLNDHTIPSVQVVALELKYWKLGDVQILIPSVYGEEAAARKSESPNSSTSSRRSLFAQQVPIGRTPAEIQFIERLFEHGRNYGHHDFYGSGMIPGMSYWYEINGQVVSVWRLFLGANGASAALSLKEIAGVAPERAAKLLAKLRTDPLLQQELADIDDDSLRVHRIRISPRLVDENAQAVFFEALDELAASAPDSQVLVDPTEAQD